MTHSVRRCFQLTAAISLVIIVPATAVADAAKVPSNPYSPYTNNRGATEVFWGDTHLHSSLSTDAFGYGARLGPDQAFRFAAGEEVTSSGGENVVLSRPLDFLVLADHAESLGMMDLVMAGDPRVVSDPTIKRWHKLITGSTADLGVFRQEFFDRKTRKLVFQKLAALSDDKLKQSIWHTTLATAEKHYRPGQFTTLLGYEYTSAPGGSNLHRVVVYRDGSDKVGKLLPFSLLDSDQPVDLWKFFARYEAETGGQVMGIPHNGNLSNGLMFPVETAHGNNPVNRDYADTRRRWEPVIEVTQIKGDGETHPLLSPDDEFADYETWDRGNFKGQPKTDDMLAHEYARSALKLGLQLDAELGSNPYQFGMIGSTDSHTALATAQEDNFFGKHSFVEPVPNRWKRLVGSAGGHKVLGWQQASSGYAAIWARENTREALWDALKRREVYATTGSRITVRFFGGWEFDADDASTPDLARVGYRKGVPMGGELTPPGNSKAPSFLLAASKDAIGANLDRIQIVKGWLDSKGGLHEKIVDVAWAQPATRELDAGGKLPAIGNTVDVNSASWSNSIGAAQLATVWRDPDFDPQQRAFYYARVIEIPSPRWTAYDAQRFAVEMSAEVPMTTQERAYTSPIWYSP